MRDLIAYSRILLKKNRLVFLLYIVFIFIAGIVNILTPYVVGKVIDAISVIKSVQIFERMIFVLIIISILGVLSNYISSYNYNLLINNMLFDLSKSIITRLQGSSYVNIKRLDSAYLVQRINNDGNIILSFTYDVIPKLILNSVNLIFIFALIYHFTDNMLVYFLIVILVYLSIYLLMRSRIAQRSSIAREAQSKYFSKLTEQLNAAEFIKIKVIDELYSKLLANSYKSFKDKIISYQNLYFTINGIESLIGILIQVVTFYFGCSQVLKNKMSIGEVTMLFNYTNTLISSCRMFLGIGKQYQEAIVSLNRLEDLHDIKIVMEGETYLTEIKSIEIKGLSFKYPDGDYLFTNLNANFEKGNIYYVVGPNGTGKSTFLKLILGLFIGEYNGEIIYNGTFEQRELDTKRLRTVSISLIELNDSYISGYLNILHNFSKEEQSQFYKIASEFGFNKLIEKVNEIFISKNESNLNLSSGEVQQLSLVCQLIRNSDVLLLDEPTAALDENSKKILWEYIDKLKIIKTVIVVTHDPLCNLPEGKLFYI